MPAPWLFALPGAIVVLMLCLSPLLSGRIVPPFFGIATFLTGGAVGAISGIVLAGLGALGLLRRKPWARAAMLGSLAPLAGAVLVVALFVARPGPTDRFNDATTDIANPPRIFAGPNASRPFPPEFAQPHRDAYPDLRSQAFETDPARAVAAVLQASREKQDWAILHRDERTGDVQFLARTSLFRFEDDLVVRVRAQGPGSVIDMRSKSRIGSGDRGANATRIRDFQARVESYLRGHPTTAPR